MMNFAVFCILIGGLGLIIGAVLFLTQLVLKNNKMRSKQILLFSTIVVVLGIVTGIAAPSTNNDQKNTLTTSSTISDTGSELSDSTNSITSSFDLESSLPSSENKEIDINEYSTEITYDELARNPEKNKGKKIILSGTIIQVIEGKDYSQYRLAVDDNYDHIVFIEIPKSLLSSRILENDIIKIYGQSYGTIDYESTLSGNITVPAITVDKFEISGQADQ
ncbi:hypothetical protein EKQ18_09480 [Enterococcus faecalis]|uniref:hypothetical protein n=1 Tax=Enterococcus faecalis TaxID=1351 RepID=UPI000CF313CE|nr:hypothetical protein [Enterococcus faecalis]EGO8540223.1 hypothetical protein [Enterococcus faecalis]PQG55790.1 hypothetical protein CUS79_05595 [Enterococcus faecalis]